MIALLFAVLALLLLLGVPVALSLAMAALLFIMISDQVPELVLIQRMVSGLDSFSLLAVPLFILAGNLMNAAGITARIFDFAGALVGWMRGGLVTSTLVHR